MCNANLSAAAVPTATPATAQPPQAAKAPPPVVPRRDPNTRLQGPRQTMSRSATLAADSSYSSAMSNGKSNSETHNKLPCLSISEPFQMGIRS